MDLGSRFPLPSEQGSVEGEGGDGGEEKLMWSADRPHVRKIRITDYGLYLSGKLHEQTVTLSRAFESIQDDR